MATVTRENIGNLHDKITVKLSKEDYLPTFEKSLKQYAKQANVPGFRKGMVPAGMVRKMYGQNLFGDEVIKTASRELEQYLNTEKVAIFAQPMILPNEKPVQLDMNAPVDVDFAFEIGVKPAISIPALEGGQILTRYKVAISDKLVDDEIERIQRRYGKVEDAEVITGRENILYATYQPLNANSEPLEGSEKKEDTVLIEKLPVKLQEELMNKKAGDKIMFTPATDFTAEELAAFMRDSLKADMSAAEQHYELEVTKVGVLMPRDLDILLYGEVFPNDNIMDEAGFRAKLKEELQREYDKISDNRMNDEIYETLVHNTPIQLPVPFLKRWMKDGQEKPRSESEVEKEFPGFDHSLRWTLISDKIILENNLQVTHDEVFNDIRSRVLAYFGMESGEEAPWMDGYMQKIAKDEKTLNETYRQLMFARLFQFLQTKFNVQEKEISEEEFFKLPSAHEAAHGHHH
jgi:trigger factor